MPLDARNSASFMSSASADTTFSDEIHGYFHKKSHVWMATHHVADALNGVATPMPLNTEVAKRAHDLHCTTLVVVRSVIWAFVLFTFFEKPLWCLQKEEFNPSFQCEVPLTPNLRSVSSAGDLEASNSAPAPRKGDTMKRIGRGWEKGRGG